MLWDVLPEGKVAGGAPFNIVNRATHLDLNACVISSIGNDALGDELLHLVASKENNTSLIQRHTSLPTSTVQISIGNHGEPTYTIVHPVAWDDIKIDAEIKKNVAGAKAFIYSSLGLRDERSRNALFELLEVAQTKICDINLRAGHFSKETILKMMDHADILKMNEDELLMVCDWLALGTMSIQDQLVALQEKYQYDAVIVTIGSKGALCYQRGVLYEQPVFPVDVKDTVGAGDAFLAGFVSQYLAEQPMDYCLQFGCATGALTASRAGGTPEIKIHEILNLMSN